MKQLEKLTTDALKIKLIHTEHFLLRAYFKKQIYVPYLSQARQKLKAEYDRRLYGR